MNDVTENENRRWLIILKGFKGYTSNSNKKQNKKQQQVLFFLSSFVQILDKSHPLIKKHIKHVKGEKE